MNNLALYVISVLIWGSTWIAIKYQVADVAPEVSVSYRYLIAAALLFAWCAFRGNKLTFTVREHSKFILLGIFLFGLNYIGTYSAQQYISSALNAVTFSTMMWMNLINSRIFLGTTIEAKVYLGAVLGLAGIITLFWPSISGTEIDVKVLIGAGFCLFAALMASFGNIISQKSQQNGLPVMQSNAWGMLYGSILTALIALAKGHEFTVELTASYTISLLYLAIFGSIIAFGSYLKLVGNIGSDKAGYAVVMFPVVAVVISYFFEDLKIEWNIVLGILLVLIGNLVILGSDKLAKVWDYLTKAKGKQKTIYQTH